MRASPRGTCSGDTARCRSESGVGALGGAGQRAPTSGFKLSSGDLMCSGGLERLTLLYSWESPREHSFNVFTTKKKKKKKN